MAVGIDQALGRQVAAGGQQAVGLGERRGYGRKRRVGIEPGDHLLPLYGALVVKRERKGREGPQRRAKEG